MKVAARLVFGARDVCDGGGFFIGDGEGEVVLGDFPVRGGARGGLVDEDARASAEAVFLVVQEFVEPGEARVGVVVEGDVAIVGDVGPALALVEVGFAVGLELVEGPAFAGVGAEEDSVGGEALEVGGEVGLCRRDVEHSESIVDGKEGVVVEVAGFAGRKEREEEHGEDGEEDSHGRG